MSFLKFLDDDYCRHLSDKLWKRRISWAQMVASSIKNDSIVLDIGAGTCIYRENFEHCKYIAHDFAKIENEPYGTIDIVSDITSVPLENDYADVVVCTEVLEHVPEPLAALKEIHRLLKKGGLLILSAPLGSGQHQKPFHYYGGFTRFFYEKFLPEIGFEIIVLENNGSIYGHLSEKLWRTNVHLQESQSQKKIHRRIIAKLIQIFIYNIPTLYFDRKEKQYCNEEDFTVGFHVIAIKT